MSARILLHERTRRQVDDFVKKPIHALLIIGPQGAGKTAVARHLASQLLGVPEEKLDDQPYLSIIEKPEDKSEISIDAIREMIRSLKLKSSGRRVILLNEAQYLSDEAQNALLKAIEEPPADSIFLMTVPTQKSVLPTIASRSRELRVLTVRKEEALEFFQEYPQAKINSAWSLSRGGAGLLSSILKDSEQNSMTSAVDQAKNFLRLDRFERVVFLDALTADKAALGVFCEALSRIYAALSDAAIQRGQQAQLRKLTQCRRTLDHALDSLKKHTSPRLVCLELALSLPV